MILALVGFFGMHPWRRSCGIAARLFRLLFVFASGAPLRRFRTPRWEDGARRVERDSELLNRPIDGRKRQRYCGRRRSARRKPVACSHPPAAGFGNKPQVDVARAGHGKARPARLALRGSLGVVVGFIIAGPQAGNRPDLRVAAGVCRFGGQFCLRRVGFAARLHRSAAAFAHRHDGDDLRTATSQAPINSTLVMRLRGTTAARRSMRVRSRRAVSPSSSRAMPATKPSSTSYRFACFRPAWFARLRRLSLQGHSRTSRRRSRSRKRPPRSRIPRSSWRTRQPMITASSKPRPDSSVGRQGQEIKTAETFVVELPAPGTGKVVSDTVYRDLTAHAYAGSNVHIVLQATDAAGQVGSSAPLTIKLPQRVFTEPLAQSLIEQRKTLAVEGESPRANACRPPSMPWPSAPSSSSKPITAIISRCAR